MRTWRTTTGSPSSRSVSLSASASTPFGNRVVSGLGRGPSRQACGQGETQASAEGGDSGSLSSASWPLKVLHQGRALPLLSSSVIAKIVAWQLRGIMASVLRDEMVA